MNIEELKKASVLLSDTIEQLILTFESETQTIVTSVGLNRMDITTIDQIPGSRNLLNVDLKVEL